MKSFLELLNNWLPTIAVIISAIVSYLVAMLKSKSEIKKVRLQFAREDKKIFAEKFADLMKKLSSAEFDLPYRGAIEVNSYLLTVSPKVIIPNLLELDKALKTKNNRKIYELRDELMLCVSKEQKKSCK